MSTTTVEQFKVKLSCKHVVILDETVEAGTPVDCARCTATAGMPRIRRVKQVLANIGVQRENIAALVEVNKPEPAAGFKLTGRTGFQVATAEESLAGILTPGHSARSTVTFTCSPAAALAEIVKVLHDTKDRGQRTSLHSLRRAVEGVADTEPKLVEANKPNGAELFKAASADPNTMERREAVREHPVERIETAGTINGDIGEVTTYDVQAANDEWKAAKAWRDGGRKGDAPATTNLDAMNATHAAGGAARAKRARKSKAANPRRAKLAGLRFYVGDRRMPDSQNKLSSVAWQATKSMPAGRMSTVALTDLLATAGIADPEGGAWSHELANGTVISAKVEPV